MLEIVSGVLNIAVNGMMSYLVFASARKGRWDEAAGLAFFYLLVELHRLYAALKLKAS